VIGALRFQRLLLKRLLYQVLTRSKLYGVEDPGIRAPHVTNTKTGQGNNVIVTRSNYYKGVTLHLFRMSRKLYVMASESEVLFQLLAYVPATSLRHSTLELAPPVSSGVKNLILAVNHGSVAIMTICTSASFEFR
jgi:hypothetical protein